MSRFLMKIQKINGSLRSFVLYLSVQEDFFRLSVNNKKQNNILAFGNAEHTGTEGLTVGKAKCYADAYL